MIRLLLLLCCLISLSVHAQVQKKFICSNDSKEAYLFENRDRSITFKPKGSLAFIMKNISKSSSGLQTYKSKQGVVRVAYGDGISKVITSLRLVRGFERQTLENCSLISAKNNSVKPVVASKKPIATKAPKVITPKASKKDHRQIKKNLVVRDTSENFSNFGKLSHIKFRPENSPLDFRYDILYYIPQKLRGQKDLKTLVFLHGGGDSTKTSYRSFKVTLDYARDLIPLADRLGIVLVLPSASGLNWSSQLLNYLKQLNIKLKEELEIDPNNIGLSGHSMGGMGITRSAHWLADEYSFFLPIAAGIDPKYLSIENMSTYFNFTYHHLQGLRDHLKVFVSRSKKQNSYMKQLESREGKKSGFNLEFYRGAHNYPLKRVEKLIEELFNKNSRDLYQKELYAIFYNRDEVIDSKWGNGSVYYLAPRTSYFWIKVLDFSKNKTVIPLHAIIKGQKINIRLNKGIKRLRVYLSTRMLSLNKKIQINVNGKVRYKGIPTLNTDMSDELKRDPGFKFDGHIDIRI